MGVEIPKKVEARRSVPVELSAHCDYMTVTFTGVIVADLWRECLRPFLGTDLVDLGHGGRFYKSTWGSSLGVMFRITPIDAASDPTRVTMELPGQACQIIGYQGLAELYQWLARNAKSLKVNRLDLAIDGCKFTPTDFYEAVASNKCRTRSERSTLGLHLEPLAVDDTATFQGLEGCVFGSRTSGRYLRVYNKHGFTRLEVEYKDKRADLVACDFFIDGEPWAVAIKHLRDFIDILDEDINVLRASAGHGAHGVDLSGHIAAFWAELVDGIGRAGARLEKTAKQITLETIQIWLKKQVACAFSVAADMGDFDYSDLGKWLTNIGRINRVNNPRYAAVLNPF